ncbi:MAG: hypothetical protein ABSB19_19610, partial [Methylomonas sp.]
MENANSETISFKCTVCGKCCNSAPLMSLPELFHHEKLFVGSLSLRRIRRHKIGETLIAQSSRHIVSDADAQLLADIAEAQLFNNGAVKNKLDYDFAVMTQAMDYESLNKCPALGEDYHCLIQEDRKPAVCSMVPFDSLYPDSLQNIVLLSRDFKEICIVNGFQDDYPIVVRDRQVVNPHYLQALKQRRDDLRMEKQYWGEAVFAMLRKEGFCNPGEAAKIPMDNGLISLSIIPALMVIAQVSKKCNARCLQYVDSQIELIDGKISQAISRKSTLDKQTTRE